MACWQSGGAVEAAMACDRCGCRMVTRSGRNRARLVCVQCGHPADPIELASRSRRSWKAAAGLLLMTMLGGLIFSLALLQEMRDSRSGQEPAEALPSER